MLFHIVRPITLVLFLYRVAEWARITLDSVQRQFESQPLIPLLALSLVYWSRSETVHFDATESGMPGFVMCFSVGMKQFQF